MPRSSRILGGAGALAALFGLTAAVGTAGSSAAGGRIPQSSCFWTSEIASKFFTDPAHNYAFPDSGAVYWTAQITMPAGSRVIVKGRFPHGRYESLNSYNAATHAPTDAIHDISTNPDLGSTNPFRAGANRNTPQRSYAITIVNRPPSATQTRNTLYAGVAGQSSQILMYRVYEPDSFTSPAELTGGVGLPAISLRLANGTVQTGAAACATLHAKTGPLPLTTLTKAQYQSYRDQPSKPATFPAAPKPLFRTFYNIQYALSCWYDNVCPSNPARTGGQYSKHRQPVHRRLREQQLPGQTGARAQRQAADHTQHREARQTDGHRADALLVDVPERVDLHH